MYSVFHILFFISVSILSLISDMPTWQLFLWASSAISGIELTVALFSNRNRNRNNDEPIVELQSSNNGETEDDQSGSFEPIVELQSSNNGETEDDQSGSFEFHFASGFSPSYMTSADELFLNGEIQPMSPLQAQVQCQDHEEASHHRHPDRILELDTPAIESGSASRSPAIESGSASTSSSSGRKKWIFKVFTCSSSRDEKKEKNHKTQKQKRSKKPIAGKRANRAQKTKKKTSVPVGQALLGCFGLCP